MGFKVNLILLLIAALLGALVWWSQPAPTPLLSNLDPASVQRITIHQQGVERPILLTRDKGAWLVDGQPADGHRIQQFLRLLRTPSLHRFAAPDSFQPYGLERPTWIVEFDSERFTFGVTDPINGWRYVLYQGTVHLIGDGFRHHLSAPADAWREPPDA
ncbi:MAG: hypothetical protein ABW076_17625 [Candidatus Thiodiazotropha sp.]